MVLTFIDKYRNLIDDISNYEKENSRKIKLVVVTKTQDYKKIIALEKEGQRDFGENYLDEAEKKITKIKNIDLVWHFIGKLQSNKIRKICRYFDWIHTVSSKKHAEKINLVCKELNKKINICIQINIDNEETKGGIQLKEFEKLSSDILKMSNINLRGIMSIPKQKEKDYDSFIKMKDLYNKHKYLDTLSMGMSNDYIYAIENSANMLRIGQQIFGSRNEK